MDEKNINISKSEEELLEIMENRSRITAGQLHNLEEDEECLQACSIIRKSKFPPNPERSVQFSGKRTKRSVQKKGCAQHL